MRKLMNDLKAKWTVTVSHSHIFFMIHPIFYGDIINLKIGGSKCSKRVFHVRTVVESIERGIRSRKLDIDGSNLNLGFTVTDLRI